MIAANAPDLLQADGAQSGPVSSIRLWNRGFTCFWPWSMWHPWRWFTG